MAIRKVTFQLEGCEKRIRQACDTTMTQRAWCEVWEKALEDAKRGKIALLSMLLPIVARKMPEENQAQTVVHQIEPSLRESILQKGRDLAIPNDTAHA